MLAQNETGAIMPVADAAAAARRQGIVAHTDAAQAVGKVDVDVDALGVDLLPIAGHKCYAPKGVGALYVRRGTSLEPVLVDAGQEHGVRPGTENVAHIVGLGAACCLAQSRNPRPRAPRWLPPWQLTRGTRDPSAQVGAARCGSLERWSW